MMAHGFKLEKHSFDKFCAYLDRCKGYDVDARKFREFWEERE